MAIKVDVFQNRFGDITGRPVRQDIRTRILDHLLEFEGPGAEDTFYFQGGMGAEEFLDSLSPRQRRDIENGYTITILVDPWELGHWYGWDTHTLFE